MNPRSEGQIRRAGESDAPALARVHVDAWQVAYQGLVPEAALQRFTYQWREARFGESLASGSEETYLLEDGGQVLGFATLGACRDPDLNDGRTGEVWGIYVAPNHWRQGVGTRLLHWTEGLLQSRGFERATMWVLAANDRARRFYEAWGYRPEGKTKIVDLGTPLRAVRYLKGFAADARQA